MLKSNKYLITGAHGQLAKEFTLTLAKQGLDYMAFAEDRLDISNFEQTEDVIKTVKPNVLINCAAYNLVDQAEEEPDLAYLINEIAVRHLAVLCKKYGIFLVHFSSDYVFDGRKTMPYSEEDQTNPVNIYGHSKLKGERAVYETLDSYLIFRLSWVFGNGEQNFLHKFEQWAQKRNHLEIVDDEVSVPTYTEDVVQVVLQALENNLTGLYHLTNSGHCSRYGWAKYYAQKKDLHVQLTPVLSDQFPVKAKRPLFTCMSNEQIRSKLNITIPTWENAVDRKVDRERKASNVSI